MTRNEILQAIIDGKEIQMKSGAWYDLNHDSVIYCLGTDASPESFRIKQNTITVNGWEIVAGETNPLRHGELYYLCDLTQKDFSGDTIRWSGDCVDERWLKRGMVHLTKKNATAHAKALLGIDPNSPYED